MSCSSIICEDGCPRVHGGVDGCYCGCHERLDTCCECGGEYFLEALTDRVCADCAAELSVTP